MRTDGRTDGRCRQQRRWIDLGAGAPTARLRQRAAFNLSLHLSLPLCLSLSLFPSRSPSACVFVDSSIRYNRNISGVVFSVIPPLIHDVRAERCNASSRRTVRAASQEVESQSDLVQFFDQTNTQKSKVTCRILAYSPRWWTAG